MVKDGESGFIDTDVERLAGCMHLLLADPQTAQQLGAEARRVARERFGIGRFVADWLRAFDDVTR